jgi:hypothetical protein
VSESQGGEEMAWTLVKEQKFPALK